MRPVNNNKPKKTEWNMDPSAECPLCGKELDGEHFDDDEIFIDPDLGFVALTRTCPCGGNFELFFDYTRTEDKEAT